MELKICPICGKTFTTRFNNKYCSAKCKRSDEPAPTRKNYLIHTLGEYLSLENVCIVCGKTFLSKRKARYCSGNCRKRYSRKRKRDSS